MTPRSSCPGEESTSSPGPKPPAHYRINTVTRNHGRNLALEPCHHPPSPASLARASATDRLVHFWESTGGLAADSLPDPSVNSIRCVQAYTSDGYFRPL